MEFIWPSGDDNRLYVSSCKSSYNRHRTYSNRYIPAQLRKCLVLDELLQGVIVNQEGDLFAGGVGVFAGYLGHNDFTGNALIYIDGKQFYRTGDLVRMDKNGLLHYISRKDFQIKLHGQRIELGEIERCLFNTSISACVVMKWNDDHLIAYVQNSGDIDENRLREHCRTYLPPHMIPSIFIILDKLPLNANGKNRSKTSSVT